MRTKGVPSDQECWLHAQSVMLTGNWVAWALLSAVFAAVTAIFAKIGLGGVDSDLATLLRTFVIVAVLAAIVVATGKWSDPRQLSGKTWLFLVLSALCTGASWICYFRALKVGDASKVGTARKFRFRLIPFVFWSIARPALPRSLTRGPRLENRMRPPRNCPAYDHYNDDARRHPAR